MSLLRRIAAPAAALTLAATCISGGVIAPIAGAAELTPADVIGDAQPATLEEKSGTVSDTAPYWRRLARNDDSDRLIELTATSPAMNGRKVPLAVLKAESENAPTIYMLNGADGGEQGGANWIQQTDIIDFYMDKDVNLVIPMAGMFSYYTDWESENADLGGVQKWETFLTKELPGPLEDYLGADNRRAIAGMSMTATTSLLFAQHNPGFYDAAGSYSGCAATNDLVGYESIKLTLDRGKATPEQMWGPRGNGTWIYNDALINSEKLRGTELYISNGSGLVGSWDLPSSPRLEGFSEIEKQAALLVTGIEGGAIEGATNWCTHNLKTKLDAQGIPADWNLRSTGTHSWGYWQDDIHESWATFARAFDMEP
ncbi:Diacylglycerol acyltransferase/mycolyltransferase Ag85A precursor [Corynebacterium occultum]|uniref:Diacylglycerol acyltransferase/mycolyltransferase Ag85A n=1 Tax=Corynebacterium occultum TaxID=2675219 RepID=A0A6B8W4D9_9CORY|nr:alpha/beta hydrolase family protein [Corynebacterium occultum]QGU07391.1 Diacylglycerol acyltransferase/mycolyltransferase Ag85A precursor [Corynebacterium occultum]